MPSQNKWAAIAQGANEAGNYFQQMVDQRIRAKELERQAALDQQRQAVSLAQQQQAQENWGSMYLLRLAEENRQRDKAEAEAQAQVQKEQLLKDQAQGLSTVQSWAAEHPEMTASVLRNLGAQQGVAATEDFGRMYNQYQRPEQFQQGLNSMASLQDDRQAFQSEQNDLNRKNQAALAKERAKAAMALARDRAKYARQSKTQQGEAEAQYWDSELQKAQAEFNDLAAQYPENMRGMNDIVDRKIGQADDKVRFLQKKDAAYKAVTPQPHAAPSQANSLGLPPPP